MKSLLLLLLFVVAAESLIWTTSSNCSCDPIDNLFIGKYEVKGNRCNPEAYCTRPLDQSYLIFYFSKEYRPPAAPEMGLTNLKGNRNFQKVSVTDEYAPICVDGVWYAQKFRNAIQYTRTDTKKQEWINDPTELNNKKLKHEIRKVMCGNPM